VPISNKIYQFVRHLFRFYTEADKNPYQVLRRFLRIERVADIFIALKYISQVRSTLSAASGDICVQPKLRHVLVASITPIKLL
jgi:hypothetical protein